MDSSPMRLPSMERSATVPRREPLSLLIAAVVSLYASLPIGRIHAEETNEEGIRIYRDRCASCHGEEGQGVDGAYAKPLIGDDSPAHLAKYIAKTMPKEDPDKCTADQAIAVANYIHEAFYSEAAQWRKRPPRREAAHLTQHQLRQSLSDLYGSFVNFPGKTEKQGVRAIYFNGDRWKNEEKKLERIDPQIDFDFDRNSPAEGIKPEAFYIYWEGAIEPPVTGRYELVVRSTCSFVMHLGKIGRTLIDNHVQSGDKTEFRQTVELTAGRSYPFKIDFIQRARKTELPPARIALRWVPPGGVEETIPERALRADWAPATFSLQASLPPDDRSYGYDRGLAVHRPWDEATTAAALEWAEIAIEELWPEYRKKQKDKPDENREILRSFLVEVLERAQRGPLDAATKSRMVDALIDSTPDDADAIRRVLLLGLKSPRFLYPDADLDRTVSQRAANRLCLVLRDSLPADRWLLEAISKEQIKDESSIRQTAQRLLEDPRSHLKMRLLVESWMNLESPAEIAKNPNVYPGFDPALVADLRESLRLQIDEVLGSPESDFRRLLVEPTGWTNERIAAFYGEGWQPAEPGPGFRKTVADPVRHIGVLNHPYAMSHLAYFDHSSPIHRGVFLTRYVLGRVLQPPQEAFSPIPPDLHPGLTTRQRVDLQTQPENCQVCHTKINGLGFALEHFDAVGRYRLEEGSKPVDTTGHYVDREGTAHAFHDARQLAELFVTTPDSARAFVSRAFLFSVKQPPAAFGADTLDRLTRHFQQSGYSIRSLMLEIAVTVATHDCLANKTQGANG
jgi:hypothetical protein